MILHTISIQVAAGKKPEAIAWAKDVDAHLENTGLTTGKTYQPLYGDKVDRMIWTWEFDSLAAFEEWHTALIADEGFQERAKAMADFFVPGSMSVMAFKEVA